MEFRTEKRIIGLAFLMAIVPAFAAGPARVEVTDAGITVDARSWTWDQIEQLKLEPARVSILTYEDRKWRLGRDREFVFNTDTLAHYAGIFREKLQSRFILSMETPDPAPIWSVPAKLLRRTGGTEGQLLFGREAVSFRAAKPSESRTYRYIDIENISSSGPLNLTLSTNEISGPLHTGSRELVFQLKQRLDDNRYNEIWKSLQEAHGFKTFYK